jgi:hypothetical protein
LRDAADVITLRRYTVPSVHRRATVVALAAVCGCGLVLLSRSTAEVSSFVLLVIAAIVAGLSGLWSP